MKHTCPGWLLSVFGAYTATACSGTFDRSVTACTSSLCHALPIHSFAFPSSGSFMPYTSWSRPLAYHVHCPRLPPMYGEVNSISPFSLILWICAGTAPTSGASRKGSARIRSSPAVFVGWGGVMYCSLKKSGVFAGSKIIVMTLFPFSS